MITTITIASISAALITLILAIILIFSSKIFKVETDERVAELTEILPGANCGGCGFPGCAQFAKALVDEKAPLDGCSVGGADTASKVANYLGKVAPPQKERTRAYIFCHGHEGIAKTNKVYNGAETCVSKTARTSVPTDGGRVFFLHRGGFFRLCPRILENGTPCRASQ